MGEASGSAGIHTANPPKPMDHDQQRQPSLAHCLHMVSLPRVSGCLPQLALPCIWCWVGVKVLARPPRCVRESENAPTVNQKEPRFLVSSGVFVNTRLLLMASDLPPTLTSLLMPAGGQDMTSREIASPLANHDQPL